MAEETLSKELQTIRDEIEAQKQTKDKENEKELLEKEEFKTLAEKGIDGYYYTIF